MPGNGTRQLTLRDTSPPTDNAESAEVCGVVERIVFESDDTGFLVGRLSAEGQPGLTTFVGNGLAVSPGETVRLWGRWVEDKRFGPQLRVERYETVMPSTAAAIEKYLGSGLVSGIGPTYAKRLVDAFGVETLRVIGEEPERLREVPGIGRKRAKQIRDAWAEQRSIQSIMLFLQGHGIGLSQAVRIYKRYGDNAVAVLRENPYRLARDVAGIGFAKADKIAGEMGIAKDSDKRAEAGLLYVLDQAGGEGHVYLPEKDLFSRAADLLEREAASLEDPLAALVDAEAAVREDGRVYSPPLHAAETGCARLLARLMRVPLPKVPIDVPRAIAWIEKTGGFALSEEQREAVRTAIASKVMVITGGPGTGKTTVLNGLLDVLDKKQLTLALAAPTGRAAKRMEAATGRPAQTVHRLLEFSPKHGGFTRHEGNPLETDLVVVDESSMLDIHLAHSLLKAMPPEARLVFVGDVDQLPSVGPGNVLMDLIASQALPVVWLKTVFRQAAESGIVSNAHRINHGDMPEYNTKDFFFVDRDEPARVLDTIVEVVHERIPAKFRMDPRRDVQVLAPMHRGDAGVQRLNEALQAALNPGVEAVARRRFGLHDKVMQTRNNYELDVYNGDTGVVAAVDAELGEVEVEFMDGRRVIYDSDALDDLTLAYASTVHKAQGSEYGAVVLPLVTQHYVMLQRNIFYTAVTRAKGLVVIVGQPKAVAMAVRNTRVTRRHTHLAARLRLCAPQ